MQGPRLRQKGDDRDPGGQRSKEDRSEGTAQWLPWPPYTHAPLNAQVPASYTHPLTVTLTCPHHPPHTHPLTALTLTPGTHASTHPPVGARRVPGVDTRIQPLASKRTDTHTHARVLARSLMFLHAHRLHTGLSSCRSPPGPQALWLPDVQVPGRLRAPTPTLAVHADGLYRAHPAQRWGHGFGGLSLLSFPPGTLPGPPPSVSPSLSPQPHSLARHWDMHPEASQQSPGLSPPPLVCPGIAQLPPRPSGLDLGARAALGAHPPRTHSASHLDWARGLRGLAWSPGGHVSRSALAGVQGLRGQGSETGWPGPGASDCLEAEWAPPGTTPLSPPACPPPSSRCQVGVGVPGPGQRLAGLSHLWRPCVEPGAGSANSTALQKGVKLGCLPGALGPAWGGVAGGRGKGAASRPGKLSQMGRPGQALPSYPQGSPSPAEWGRG